jgi:predicted DNA-binding transcriptional regulator AlpA
MNDRNCRRAPRSGTRVVWPAGLEEMFGISAPTRWRWERDKKLPPRDVHLGTRSGWRLETIERLLNGQAA